MTSHELAKKLLEQADLPVLVHINGSKNELEEVYYGHIFWTTSNPPYKPSSIILRGKSINDLDEEILNSSII